MLVCVENVLINPHSVNAQPSKNNPSNWDYHFHSSSSDDDLFPIIILLAILIILMIYFIKRFCQKRKKNHQQSDSRLNKEYVETEEEIEKVIPHFNLEEFKNMVFEKHKELEIAYMEFDHKVFKNICTESLYLSYHSQLESLKRKGYQNKKSDFRQITFRVIDLLEDNKDVSLKVRTTIWCYDYIVDDRGVIVEGDPDKRCVYEYEMIWTSSNQGSTWLLSKQKIISKK